MVTGATDAETTATDAETTATTTATTVAGTFEDLNWGVFLKNGNPIPQLLGAAKGKTKAKNLVTTYLADHPTVDKATIIARPLGKTVSVRTKEVHTF